MIDIYWYFWYNVARKTNKKHLPYDNRQYNNTANIFTGCFFCV